MQSRLFGSVKRIFLSVLVAIPSTAVVAALLHLVPPIFAFVAGVTGMVFFRIGASLNRPILVGLGGVVMFGGVFSWALRQ